MPDYHMKGQPAAPTYVREKGCLKSHSNRETPCSLSACPALLYLAVKENYVLYTESFPSK